MVFDMDINSDTGNDSDSPPDNFKTCSMCNRSWASREVFLQDPELRLIGYQANFAKLETGIFLFYHSCGTTISIRAKDFLDLYNGPVYKDRETGSDQCPGYCLVEEELSPCPAHCECAYVREVAAILRSWPKLSAPLP